MILHKNIPSGLQKVIVLPSFIETERVKHNRDFCFNWQNKRNLLKKKKKKNNETKINNLPDKESINVYAPNIGAPKYIKQILTDMEKLTII